MANREIFFGRNSLREALRARIKIHQIFFENVSSRAFVMECIGKNGGPKLREGLPREARGDGVQGVAFEAEHHFYISENDWQPRSTKKLLLLNHLEDVQNLGSISRIAAAFGVDMIIHERHRSVRVTPTVVKLSSGMAFHLRFLEVSNLLPLIQSLKKNEFEILGLEAVSEAGSLYDWTPSGENLALVLGSEAKGLATPIQREVDQLLRIPMSENIDSLNVSHATGIALSWVFQRMSSSIFCRKSLSSSGSPAQRMK